MDSEQLDDQKELRKALAILDEEGVGIDQGADVRLQIAVLLMLATRIQRLNYQLENLIAATRRS